MGRRDINPSYDEVHPRVARYIVDHQICAVGDVRVQLDGLTHDDVIWTPYEDHKLSRPFETIYLFSGHLRLGSLSQRQTNQLKLKKKQIGTAKETMNRNKAGNELKCRTKKKLNMF